MIFSSRSNNLNDNTICLREANLTKYKVSPITKWLGIRWVTGPSDTKEKEFPGYYYPYGPKARGFMLLYEGMH